MPDLAPRRNSIFKQLMSVHWWMAMFYAILIVSGIAMEKLGELPTLRNLFYAGHKSFGVLVIFLLLWRLYLLVRVWGKKYSKHLPKFTSNWYFKTGLHTVLYALMVVVPVSGYWLSNAYRANNVSLFGIPMPDLFPVNSEARDVAGATHGISSKIFAALIVIHAIAQYKVIRANWRRFTDWLSNRRAKAS
jgi:cytochrome b561